MAIAAIRATREATLNVENEELPSLVGIPMSGESLGEDEFDGETEFALFPGDLPEDPESVFKPVESLSDPTSDPILESGSEDRNPKTESVSQAPTRFEDPLRFVRFRPPELERRADGTVLSLPIFASIVPLTICWETS